MPRTPHLLLILDGWGYRKASENNAIALANTPTWDRLWQTYPHCLLEASGQFVGLPNHQMGNSEVGHMNIGTGRVVYQDLTRINNAIQDGALWEQNSVLTNLFQNIQQTGKSLHLMGLLSPGGVHSHENHLIALLKLAHQQGLKNQLRIHAFLDGRDTPPKSAKESLLKVEQYLDQHQLGSIATLCGRFYAMDRDERWDRIQAAYDLMTLSNVLPNDHSNHSDIQTYQAPNALAGIEQAYARNETDEFISPTRIGDFSQNTSIQDQDAILCFNFRSDRARQISKAFLIDDFSGFDRHTRPSLSQFVSMTQYATDIPSIIAFPPQTFPNCLGSYLSQHQKTQLRIAETEKYAHVTFFLNGGIEHPFPNEDRCLINSPKEVATYDLKPEMSAYEVTQKLIEAIESQQYDVLICNLANGDMVGHTGNLTAAIQAAEVIDDCLEKLIQCLQTHQGHCLITADHGNIEMMRDPNSQQAHTAHTSNPVPLIYVNGHSNQAPSIFKQNTGALCDISPTLLHLLGLQPPEDMTGQCLLDFD